MHHNFLQDSNRTILNADEHERAMNMCGHQLIESSIIVFMALTCRYGNRPPMPPQYVELEF